MSYWRQRSLRSNASPAVPQAAGAFFLDLKLPQDIEPYVLYMLIHKIMLKLS